MKFFCQQSDLKKALSIVGKCVPSRATHPILETVKFEIDSNTLTLTTFNLSSGSITNIPIDECSGVEGFCLPFNLLSNLINKLPEQKLTFEKKEENITIGTKSGEFILQSFPLNDYPELPEVKTENKIILDANLFIDSLGKTCFAASTDETKQVLTGVHLSIKENQIELAATNGHRLSCWKTETDLTEEIDITIPSKALREFYKSITEDSITLYFEDTYLKIETEQQTFITRILEGTYPSYQQLIPTEFEHKIVCERKKLIQALDLISVFFDNNAIFTISQDSINLTTKGTEIGNSTQLVKSQYLGKLESPIKISFNIKYVLEGLKNIDSEEIKLKINTPQSPAIFTHLIDDFLYLVMPVQIRE